MNQATEKLDVKEDVQVVFREFEKYLNGSSQSDLHQLRKKALNVFQDQGFPGLKHEEYKYTHLGKAFEKNFDFRFQPEKPAFESADLEKMIYRSLDATRAVFVNGIFMPELSDIQDHKDYIIAGLKQATQKYPEDVLKYLGQQATIESDPFVALNTAFADQGIFVKVKNNTVVEKPVVLYYITDNRKEVPVIHPRNLIIVGTNSQVQVIESFQTTGNQKSFSNEVTEILVDENAKMDYYKIQTESDASYHVGTTQINQQRYSLVNAYSITLSGAMIRNNLNIALDDENCEAHMYGLYLLHNQSHVDNHTMVDHRKPNSFSNELYKGVLHDQSTGVFNGKIFVRQDAQKTNAFQSNKNILLTDKANIYTKPQLEIWADDVKCSHGCTTGQIDEEQLFYLRSRGIHEDSAKAMLLIAFVNDILEKINIEGLKKSINQQILDRLHKDLTFD